MMQKTQNPSFEFTALMAALMSIVALSIDTLMPAIAQIGIAVDNLDATKNQQIITMIFLGLGVGQLIFGPLSDAWGRKPVVYLGILIFGMASFVCLSADSLAMMVWGRIFQGIGLSTARTISVAIIRDLYKGDVMARVMSFVTAFFILVPIVAPLFGKFILSFGNWQTIFYIQLILTGLVGLWFWKRQEETLKSEYKTPFSMKLFWGGFLEFMRYKETVVYTIVSGLITGSFLVYLSSAQHVFENLYNMPDVFPYIFAGLALSIGTATFFNGTLVLKYGMRRLSTMALMLFFIIALVFCLVFPNGENPDVLMLLGFLILQFFCLGFLWGNFRAIAMEPIGHIAGVGAAINGFFSTVVSIPIASFIGAFLVDSVWPLFMGLFVCGFLAFVVVAFTTRLSFFFRGK